MKMSSLSKVGLGLSVVFTCLLLALVAEIYYLLWWKRRIIRRKFQDDYNYNHPRRDFSYHFCCKNSVNTTTNTTEIQNQESSASTDQEFQFVTHNNKDYYGPTSELIIGQPRFLFTIKEETKEDLESEDGNREGKRSLNDLFSKTATPPYLTPLSSPQFVTPPLTPVGSCHSSQSGGGYNPFYEASTDAEFSKIVRTSPPPKFKFLRDAEDKLQRRIMLFEQAKNDANKIKEENENENDGSFITIIVANNNENDKQEHHHYHSPRFPSGDTSSSSSTSTSQVLPLASSPSHLPPSNRKFINFLTL